MSAIEQWNYVYDSVGNIIAVKNDDIDVVSYEYDSLGQLTRENNVILGKTYTYSYDNYGNLTSVKTYNYTTGALTGTALNTDTYTYSNGDWGDQLVSFNGQTITYDQMGNPTTYLGATLSWENIRQLASYVKGNTNVSYTYNVDGIRTSKTVNGVTHTYALEGTRILLETYGTVLIVYLYDEAGSPIGLAYRDSATANTTLDKEKQFTYYLFTKNLQGDIIGIYNEQGQIVTLYRYDAWGNHTVHNWTDDNIGNINPFRYRGYYYDTETGLYYLNSRYYDPQVKRFINADDISYLGANGDMQGFNLYAYCSNNPVNMYDFDGRCSRFLGFLWKVDCKQASCPNSKNYIKPKAVDPVGTYNKGRGYVYIITEDQMCILEEKEDNVVVILDKRDSDDPDMKVLDSYKIANKKQQKEIAQLMINYNTQNPVNPAWSRTLDSLVEEWRLHNFAYTFGYKRDRTGDCDFNNADEGKGFWDFIWR